MKREDFKYVIAEWLQQGIPEVKGREILLPLDSSLVTVVTGARRSGKTYLLFLTMKRIVEEGRASPDEILYLDFEHARLKGVTAADLDEMLVGFYELTGKRPKYLFLDEIQGVRDYGGWFRKRLDARVYLSGSSSALTPKRIAGELRGRCVNYEVYPLSFREYLSFLGHSPPKPEVLLHREERGKLLSLLRDYLQYGAYPAVALEGDKKRVLKAYFDSVVVRDLGGTPLAETLALYLTANYAQPMTLNRIYNYLRSLGFQVGKEKTMELLERARETYFAFTVEQFRKSERERKMNPKKLYIVDTGYPTALGYEFSVSRAMENAVYLELLRRGKGEVYYWKEYGKSTGAEVDFVVSKNFRAEELIQVTYGEEEIREREVRALEKAKEELEPKKLKILTWDYRGEIEGMEAVPLWYWLLT
ncbi:MAG: AAA family ATPase [Hadesarchaea archaeon]|nr:MAG: AAA family ATPase [Hadesarchaea archaeon]